MSIQVIRAGEGLWEVTRVKLLWTDGAEQTHEYETIGRIVFEPLDGLYYVEVPRWKFKGKDWERQGRGYAIPAGAIRALTKEPAKREKQ